jgi:hypothetical protein
MDQPSRTLKDVFHVAGDAPDPTGTGLRGVAPGYRLNQSALGHPMLLWRVPGTGQEMILEADVYALPDQPMHIYLLCPVCLMTKQSNQLSIRADHKKFDYEPFHAVPTFPGWTHEQMAHAFPNGAGGRLSVEPFRCTFEMTPDMQRAFGLNQCTFSVAIDNNVVRNV